MGQLIRFAWLEARACGFAVALLAGLAVTKVLGDAMDAPLGFPLHRYDVLFLYGIGLALLFRIIGLESTRDVLVIGAFHLLGLAFELVKVGLGSWHYPDPAILQLAGVPLFGGFMYAAVGSYVVRAWQLLDLELIRYRPAITAAVAAAIYVNFLTHHWLPDLRWPLAGLMVSATWGTTVRFTVGRRRYRMPLALSFVSIGLFLWLAENIATYLGAWRYPHQDPIWEPVGATKIVAWALLVTVSIVLVAATRGSGQQRTDRVP